VLDATDYQGRPEAARPRLDPNHRRHLRRWDIDRLAATMADVLAADDDTADSQSLPRSQPQKLRRQRGISGEDRTMRKPRAHRLAIARCLVMDEEIKSDRVWMSFRRRAWHPGSLGLRAKHPMQHFVRGTP
jgi:hypothetical protein